jgi:hypothetical protein
VKSLRAIAHTHVSSVHGSKSASSAASNIIKDVLENRAAHFDNVIVHPPGILIMNKRTTYYHLLGVQGSKYARERVL